MSAWNRLEERKIMQKQRNDTMKFSRDLYLPQNVLPQFGNFRSSLLDGMLPLPCALPETVPTLNP